MSASLAKYNNNMCPIYNQHIFFISLLTPFSIWMCINCLIYPHIHALYSVVFILFLQMHIYRFNGDCLQWIWTKKKSGFIRMYYLHVINSHWVHTCMWKSWKTQWKSSCNLQWTQQAVIYFCKCIDWSETQLFIFFN